MSTTHVELPLRAGVFSDLRSADEAVRALLALGYSAQQISVLCSDEAVQEHYRVFEHERPAGTFTPLAALAGTTIGAALGGVTVLAAAAATGGAALLATGGIAAWAGGVAGGLIGAMMTRGVEKEAANFYNQAVQQGQILVVVEDHESPSKLGQAEIALAEAGAKPLSLPEG